MAGGTITRLHRLVDRALCERDLRIAVAGEAEPVGAVLEELGDLGTVRVVAGGAVACRDRRVGHLSLARRVDVVVTRKARFGHR
jgi:hypothetical protein